MYELLQSVLGALARGIAITDRPEVRTGNARDALRWAEAVLQAQPAACGDDVRALALLAKAAALAVLCDFEAAAESAGEASQELWMLAEAAGQASAPEN